MDPLFALLVFIAGIILLVKGGDWLITSASVIARKLRVSPLIIGLTVVSIGTSLPELFVAIFAILGNTPDISVGNIVGSNIANIALVIGVAALIQPLVIREKTLLYEFPFLLVSSFLLLVLSNDNNIFQVSTFTIGRFDGLIFLLTLIFFTGYVYKSMKTQREKKVEKEFKEEFGRGERRIHKRVIFLFVGIASLVIGGKLLVASAEDLALTLGLSEKFVGLTMVALGTSLPELFATGVAAFKNQPDIAVGNVVGSSILNILFVLGISGLAIPFSMSASLVHVDMVIMTAVTFMFLVFAITGRKLERHEGGILLAGYIAYIAYLVMAL